MKTAKIFLWLGLMVCATAAYAADIAIPQGLRAVVVPVHEEELMLLKPGDKVDMLVTIREEGGEAVYTPLQKVLVMDTIHKKGITCVILALRPNEAQYAALFAGYRVKFVLRGKNDEELHPMEPASLSRIFKASKDAAPEVKTKAAAPEKAQ